MNFRYIIAIEKGKTSNGYAKFGVKKITLPLDDGGYFFMRTMLFAISHIIQHRADGVYGKAEHKKYTIELVILRIFWQGNANA